MINAAIVLNTSSINFWNLTSIGSSIVINNWIGAVVRGSWVTRSLWMFFKLIQVSLVSTIFRDDFCSFAKKKKIWINISVSRAMNRSRASLYYYFTHWVIPRRQTVAPPAVVIRINCTCIRVPITPHNRSFIDLINAITVPFISLFSYFASRFDRHATL